MDDRRVQDVRIAELSRRCVIKETVMSQQAVKLATAEQKILELEGYRESSDLKILELQAWKNKAAGYVGGFVLLAGILVEAIRDQG